MSTPARTSPESPAGLWAMVDVPARDTATGYRMLLDGWFQVRPRYALEGDPHLERHGVTPGGDAVVTVGPSVRPAGREGDWNMAVLEPDAGATP